MNVGFTAEAVKDVIAISDWWAANRDTRELFDRELAAAVGLLAALPRIGQRITRAEREVRRVVLRRTGYLLFYEVRVEELVVLRVWHPMQRPDTHGV